MLLFEQRSGQFCLEVATFQPNKQGGQVTPDYNTVHPSRVRALAPNEFFDRPAYAGLKALQHKIASSSALAVDGIN